MCINVPFLYSFMHIKYYNIKIIKKLMYTLQLFNLILLNVY